jgi:tetratricopeptide (TPR) repeat protein
MIVSVKPTMTINRKTRRDIIDLLMPYMDADQRRTLISGAFWGDSILERIAWDGDAAGFSATLVNTLLMDGPLDDGENPVVALLDEMRLHAPPADRARVDDLLARVRSGDQHEPDRTPGAFPVLTATPSDPASDEPPPPATGYFAGAADKLRERDYDGAIAAYKAAIAAGDKPAEAHYQIGRVLEIQKDTAGALAHYDKSADLLPDARTYTRRGVIYALRGNREAALLDFARATNAAEPDPSGYFYRAMLHFDEQNYDDALDDLAGALRLQPDCGSAYRERGVIYAIRGDYLAAIREYDAAVQHNPDDAEAHYYRGNAYDTLGDTQAALADYSAAIRANPNTALFYYQRGKVRFGLQDYGAVIRDMAAALARDDTLADAHYLLALCRMQHENDYADAARLLERALQLDPDNKNIQAGLRIAREQLDA